MKFYMIMPASLVVVQHLLNAMKEAEKIAIVKCAMQSTTLMISEQVLPH